MAYKAHTLFIFVVSIATVITSSTYAWKYASADFDGAMFTSTIALQFVGLIYTLIVTISNRHQIRKIFVELSSIYNARKFDNILKSGYK